jgi:phage-related protein
MAEALTNKAGPALRLLNKDIEEGAAVLMVMANSGLKGRAAGTALGIVLRELQTKAIANKKEFAEMGVAVYDAEGNMRNIADIIGDLEGALEGLTDEQKKEAMLSMGFTDRSVGFIQQLLGQSDAIAQYEEELRKAGGTTEEVAEKQLDTFNAQLEIMWHKIQDVAITIGQALLPRAKDAVKAFGDWVDENHELISSIAIGLFDAIGKVMGVIGTFIGVIGTVIEKLQPVVRWVGDLIFVLKHLDAYAGKDGFFGQLATLILPIVEGFEDLVGWIGQTAGEMDIIGTVMPIVGEIFRFFSEEILPTFVALWTALVEDVLPRLVDAFTVIAETVGPALGDLFSWIAEEMLPKLGMAFEWLREDVLPPVISLFEFIVSWFISNWPTISSIAKQVFGAVGEAIEFVAGVVGHVVPVIWGLLQPIAAVLFPLLGAAASVLLSAIDIAFKAIGLVFEVFGNVATGIYHAVTTVWSAMGDFFGGIWDNIDETFRGGINVLIGLINGFFGFLNNIHIDIPSVTIPGIDATIGGGSIDPFNIGLIPELWRGTRGWGGGLALVGEQGPELVAMPQGSNVYSNRELGGMGGPSEVHYHKHFSPDIDIDVPEREPLTKDDVVNILRDLSRLEAV